MGEFNSRVVLKTLLSCEANDWTNITKSEDISTLGSLFTRTANFCVDNTLDKIIEIGVSTVVDGVINSYTRNITYGTSMLFIDVYHGNIGSVQKFAFRYNSGNWQYKHIS